MFPKGGAGGPEGPRSSIVKKNMYATTIFDRRGKGFVVEIIEKHPTGVCNLKKKDEHHSVK
jgi:hypothetical protein